MDNADTELLAGLARRVRLDNALIARLLEAAAACPKPRLCARIRAVTLGTESLFLDASPRRIELRRHLGAAAAWAAAFTGGRADGPGGGEPVWCEAGRAVLLGMAVADLACQFGDCRLSLDGPADGRFRCAVAAAGPGRRRRPDTAFAGDLIRRAVDADGYWRAGSYGFEFGAETLV